MIVGWASFFAHAVLLLSRSHDLCGNEEQATNHLRSFAIFFFFGFFLEQVNEKYLKVEQEICSVSDCISG